METHIVSSVVARSTLVLLIAATAACEGTKSTDIGINCPDLLRPSIVAEIRDGNGKASAIGATVSVFRNDRLLMTASASDSLRAFVYSTPTGLLDVQVTKPFFTTVLIRGVDVPATVCGNGTANVSAKLIAVAN